MNEDKHRIAALEWQLRTAIAALENHADETIPEVACAIEWGWNTLRQQGRWDKNEGARA